MTRGQTIKFDVNVAKEIEIFKVPTSCQTFRVIFSFGGHTLRISHRCALTSRLMVWNQDIETASVDHQISRLKQSKTTEGANDLVC